MIILTRQQANNLSDNLVGIMTEIEDELLRKIAAQIARDNDISDTSKWRMRQLARMGQLDKEALRLIKSYSRIQSDVLYDTLMNAALTEIGYVDAGMREAAAKGLISGDMTIPADRTAENALKAYYKQAQSDLNMVNTVMGYQATAAYTGAINNIYYAVHKDLDTGTAKIVTGSESLQSAIRQTIHNLSRNGIPAFVDRGGHHWSPEAYVRMDLRTTVGNTARAAQWSRCDNFGVSLIAVDSHPGARPKCAPYQGRIFSRDGSSGTTTDGSGRKITYSPLSSTSYGEPDGLFGINCGHSCYPFIPGVNFQRYFPYDPEENAARYKEFQTQRALEREIRAAKRECMMLETVGDKGGYQKAALRLRTQREKYRAYSNEHGLSLHNDRTQGYGFDHSQSMKAVWAQRKAQTKVLTSGNNGGTITSKLKAKGILKNHDINDCFNTTNPKYGTGNTPNERHKYTWNCQRCVNAYEARRRGFDVQAGARKESGDTLPNMRNAKGWPAVYEGGQSALVPIDGRTGSKIRQNIESQMAAYGDGARAIVRVVWQSRGGHVFIAEQVNGQTQFIDPQSGKRDVSYYFGKGMISSGYTHILRIDDKKFTDLIFDCLE